MKELSPKQLIAKIKELGFANVERALSLPYGYLAQLESRIYIAAPEDIALLRIVNYIPWVLEVAANGYKDADKIMFENVIVKPELEIQKKIENKEW